MTARPPSRGDDEFWPDEHDHLPTAWWRMPDDIRLQVRVRVSDHPDVAFATDFDNSLSVYGPLYVNLAHLTLWNTHHRGQRPQPAAHQHLTRLLPGVFTMVHAIHPGTVYLALRLHRLTDQVAEAVLTQRATVLTALGVAPDTALLLGLP